MSINDINNAINRRRAKYAKQQRDRDKHGFIDLTGISYATPKQSDGTKTLKATIGYNNGPTVSIVQENKGGFSVADTTPAQDEYEKYSKMFDGDADDFLLAQDATIISSTLELTDSSGRNRILVRKQI